MDEEERRASIEFAKQAAKKKMLGNVKFIGELGKLDLLSEAILHKCIKTLLEKKKEEKYADMSDDLECLCKMMPTIGSKLDQGEAVKLMDQYFERMKKLRTMSAPVAKDGLPQRIKFLLQDCIDLRTNKWTPRQTQLDQAPKTMNEVRGGEPPPPPPSAANAKYSQFVNEMDIVKSTAGGTAPLIYQMYQQFTQQPNMSLLNAINDITLGKKLNPNSQFLLNDGSDDTSSSFKYVNDELNESDNDDRPVDDSAKASRDRLDSAVESARPTTEEARSVPVVPPQPQPQPQQPPPAATPPQPQSTPTPPPPSLPPPPKSVSPTVPINTNSINSNYNYTSRNTTGYPTNQSNNSNSFNNSNFNGNTNSYYRQHNRPNNYRNQPNSNNLNHLDQSEYPTLNNNSTNNNNNYNSSE